MQKLLEYVARRIGLRRGDLNHLAPRGGKFCLISKLTLIIDECDVLTPHTDSQMEDIPSLSSGSVGSRFVSQADIDEAKKKRDEQWRAAYAR